jgi:Fe-S cluster biogenesis protein NfuA
MVKKDSERIKRIIDEVKPVYTFGGGDVEFAGVRGRTVRVRPSGYCHS